MRSDGEAAAWDQIIRQQHEIRWQGSGMRSDDEAAATGLRTSSNNIAYIYCKIIYDFLHNIIILSLFYPPPTSGSMYVCMYVCVCMCMYVYVCVCMCMYMYVYVYVCVCMILCVFLHWTGPSAWRMAASNDGRSGSTFGLINVKNMQVSIFFV